MSTKGMSIVKEVNFIEYCRKEHVCTFCATPIPKTVAIFHLGNI